MSSIKKKIILAYTGSEQGTWGTIAYRKEHYYHFLPGIVYLAAALKRSPVTAEKYEVATRHFNRTVQDIHEIVSDIAAQGPDCLGLACYCWNMTFHLEVAQAVKEKLPQVKIVLGGPEIGIGDTSASTSFFNENPYVDLLVFGEAEEKISVLIDAVLRGSFDQLTHVSGYYFNPAIGAYSNLNNAEVSELREIPSIYPCPIEVKRSSGCGIQVVYEASRGCPHRCIYCQFTHWRKKQESFPSDRVRRELAWLLEQEIDGIHFADAVFDRDPEMAKRILRFIIANNRRTTIFCYCSFHNLNGELADLYEKTQCQIGVGLQSTDTGVLRILRRSYPKRLFENVSRFLKNRSVNFYVDLMFGLPGDTLEIFQKSFEDSLRINPSFLMLFPLALINGTALGDDPGRYGVISYNEDDLNGLNLQCDIEYVNLGLSENFGIGDLETFDDVTLTCFYFYNRLSVCLRFLQKKWQARLFTLYQLIGHRTKEYLSRTGEKPTNNEFSVSFTQEVEAILKDMLNRAGADEKEIRVFNELYKIDMFRNVVMQSQNRKKIFDTISKLNTCDAFPNAIQPSMKLIKSTFGKVITIECSVQELFNLSHENETLPQKQHSVFVFAPYSRADAHIVLLDEKMKFIIDLLTTDRGLRYKSIYTAFRKQFQKTIETEDVLESILTNALKQLYKYEIIKIFT